MARGDLASTFTASAAAECVPESTCICLPVTSLPEPAITFYSIPYITFQCRDGTQLSAAKFLQRQCLPLCFRFQVEQIPGEPCARPLTLVNAFMERFHQRKFSWEDDYIYTPSNIDHDKGKAYLILDVNKQCVPKPATEDEDLLL
jgi:hypothetical protein